MSITYQVSGNRYLTVSISLILSGNKYLIASIRMQAESRESIFIAIWNFSIEHFLFTWASPRGARAPKNEKWTMAIPKCDVQMDPTFPRKCWGDVPRGPLNIYEPPCSSKNILLRLQASWYSKQLVWANSFSKIIVWKIFTRSWEIGQNIGKFVGLVCELEFGHIFADILGQGQNLINRTKCYWAI